MLVYLGWLLMIISVLLLISPFVIGWLSDFMFDTNYGIPIYTLVLLILFSASAVILAEHYYKKDMNNCKSVGGNYIVVDKIFNGKVWVDIFGCVK